MKADGRSKAARAEKEQKLFELARACKTSNGRTVEIEIEAPGSRQVGGDHYLTKAVQPWEAMEAWMSPEQFAGFLRGNSIKYLARCDDKGGIDDLKKAQHYLEKLIEFSEEQ